MVLLSHLLLLAWSPSCTGQIDPCQPSGCDSETSGTDSSLESDSATDSPTDTASTPGDSGTPTIGNGLLDVSGWDPVQPWPVTVTPVPLVPGETATVTYTGPLAGESVVWMHYGFNGWNEVTGLEDLQAEVSFGDSDWFLEAPMTNNGDGSHTVSVALPTDGRGMHMAFLGEDSSDWDNNDQQDYGEGLVFPYAGPWMTWSSEVGPTDGVVVSFQTAVPCLGTVEYGTTPDFGHHKVGTRIDVMHQVVLPALSPDTTYYYRVYDSRGRVSDTYTFSTVAQDTDALSLLVMGDMQDGGATQRWDDVAETAATDHSDVDAIFLVGDMAYNDKPGHWWTFFDKGRPLLGSVPVLPVPGNHDTPGSASTTQLGSFVRYFALPYSEGAGTETDTHWSLQVGPVALLGFNSEDIEGFQPDYGDQYVWATQALTEHSDARWVFAAWHVPPYNVGNRHYQEQHDTRPVTETFDGVLDWVFCGHEHLAQRLLPLRHNGVLAPSAQYGRGSEDGVGYLIAPPAGNDPSDQLVPPDAEKSYYRDRLAWPVIADDDYFTQSEIGFTRVDVQGDEIRIRTYGQGDLTNAVPSHVRDEHTYVRTDRAAD